MRRAVFIVGGVALLSGCGGREDPIEDLRAMVEKPLPPPDEEALKEPPAPAELLQVSFRKLPRSPFQPISSLQEAKSEPEYTGPRPDSDRPRDPLEKFPLGSLQLVATMDFPNKGWRAYVEAPDGVTYAVKPGSYMGQQYGRVEEIRPRGVVLRELVPRGEGRWEPHRRTVEIKPTGG